MLPLASAGKTAQSRQAFPLKTLEQRNLGSQAVSGLKNQKTKLRIRILF